MSKRWEEKGVAYWLFFKDKPILGFAQDEKNPQCFTYVSDEMGVEYDEIYAGSIEEAKIELEEKFKDYLNEKISYYEDMLLVANNER